MFSRSSVLRQLPLTAAVVSFACITSACGGDDEPLRNVPGEPGASQPALQAQSWPLCTLLGPDAKNPGVYGSDLGFTASMPQAPDQLAVLFGDTWAGNEDVCTYPVSHSDDMLATLPFARPADLTVGAPTASAASACAGLQYPLEPTTPPEPAKFAALRLFPDAAERDPARQIDMSMLRTPAAAFTDGSNLFGVFV
ncbi:MAG: hypothetical protein ABW321_05270, partial [Polyangiales bacterium]